MEQVTSWRKSSYSGNNGGACVEVGSWRKSTFSGNNGGDCVEVGNGDAVLVRDTTNRGGGTLAFSAETWRGFVVGLK